MHVACMHHSPLTNPITASSVCEPYVYFKMNANSCFSFALRAFIASSRVWEHDKECDIFTVWGPTCRDNLGIPRKLWTLDSLWQISVRSPHASFLTFEGVMLKALVFLYWQQYKTRVQHRGTINMLSPALDTERHT